MLRSSCLMSCWKTNTFHCLDLPSSHCWPLYLPCPSTWARTMMLIFTKAHLAKKEKPCSFSSSAQRTALTAKNCKGTLKPVSKRQGKSKKYWDLEQECSRHYFSRICPDSDPSPPFEQVCSKFLLCFSSGCMAHSLVSGTTIQLL